MGRNQNKNLDISVSWSSDLWALRKCKWLSDFPLARGRIWRLQNLFKNKLLPLPPTFKPNWEPSRLRNFQSGHRSSLGTYGQWVLKMCVWDDFSWAFEFQLVDCTWGQNKHSSLKTTKRAEFCPELKRRSCSAAAAAANTHPRRRVRLPGTFSVKNSGYDRRENTFICSCIFLSSPHSSPISLPSEQALQG